MKQKIRRLLSFFVAASVFLTCIPFSAVPVFGADEHPFKPEEEEIYQIYPDSWSVDKDEYLSQPGGGLLRSF